MQPPGLDWESALKNSAAKFLAEAIVVAYMGAIALVAHATGISLFLFPELAALSYDVMVRPRGKWASQPWRIIVTPTLAAILGLFISRHANYSALAITALAIGGLLIIQLLRSTIAPAISAGMLPLVLNEKSWIYPCAVCAGLTALVALLLLWQRYGSAIYSPSQSDTNDFQLVDILESKPHGRLWVVVLLVFVAILGTSSQLTGLHFILFPPLVVMAYELLGHPEVPGWAARPALFPVVCALTASAGLLASHVFHLSVAGVVLTMLGSIGLSRLFQLHMPPALAIGLLPFVMTAPSIWYPISVAIGATTLSLFVAGYNRIQNHSERSA